MAETTSNIVIGGEAGQGLATIGEFLARGLVRAGYGVVVTQDYQSRIRGGHNTFAIRTGNSVPEAPIEAIDLLVALSADTVPRHQDRLTGRGLVLADARTGLAGLPGLAIPYQELCPKPLYENTAALGVLSSLLCLDPSFVTDLITEKFTRKGDEVVAANIAVFKAALDWTAAQKAPFACLPPAARREKRLVMHGNDAIALGGLAAGVNFCSFYPMTPGTSVIQTLIDHADAMGLVAEQAEDEIAAILMAIGASYAGARSMVSTAGGGFALMCEGTSLAGMLETPVTLVVAQRPGPATGLPTRTEQADLDLVVYAGHGEFPRAVFAPGSLEQCFHLAHRAVDTAERFQSPAFILTDQFLADSYRDVGPFDLSGLPAVARPLTAVDDPAGYERYAVTDSGVSPRLLPGFTEATVVLDSDEHTPDGHITEDLSVRVAMQDKRMRKLAGLTAAVLPPDLYGEAEGATLLVCWGSTLGAAREAADSLAARGEKTAVLHFSQVFPLAPDTFLPFFAQAGRTVMVEGNFAGQLAGRIRQGTGHVFDHHIRRYDGLPFTAAFILERL
ncbi:2-oxoacid:acceptor oxidoreductase, alpha subunit [Solidesulfovibrio carbinoliphilus subsp. oakridgensis]|uniref:2-oxoacid:acceptor oxidoreductase, alpha subunit n=1 Tax=Solidesulfovibrio carbinoliphilus subsp. oakridgensis TaxID=694327 RepID=G7Q4L8_9BACT|nr:2-oxoacid:acceptor oxidoreductase subunit alpha [Solidesulfovibrio carbinoliphilus]EHJ47241.1 2-oxoacid:acceptor oxidoreductase, alpha subunit [Solidesulfovibrio carbinoliphilus subsp. oakridgensis]